MAREEIVKQVAFLGSGIRNFRFRSDCMAAEFDLADDADPNFVQHVKALVEKVERGLRSLQRKVAFRSSRMDQPAFRAEKILDGVHKLGVGQVALEGIPQRLFRYFDRLFLEYSGQWKTTSIITPTLISAQVLAKCDYFRSFPNNVTFASHLQEDVHVINGFRERHEKRDTLDEQMKNDLAVPCTCLSPAVCYHVYHLYQDRTLPGEGIAADVCGKCFRYESSNMSDLRRLWDFTMREVVFLGGREGVLKERDLSIEKMKEVLETHKLAGEIRTASDPFFVAPDAVAKTFFQLKSDTKYEISLLLPGGERLAVGSHNYHGDFFGRVFNVRVEGAGAMHSVCVAFGLERWVHAFIMQHGNSPSDWPDAVRLAPEFA